MPGAKKKITRKARSPKVAGPAHNSSGSRNDHREVENVGPAKELQAKSNQRKRGWRDIEAIVERARLKNMLTDIWHEDIEIDEEIFGGSDQVSSYYTDLEVDEEIEVEVEDEAGEAEEFEEKEK